VIAESRRGYRRAGVMVGATVAGAVALHALPGTVAWRRPRCLLLPQLSGVGLPGHVALTFDDGPDPDSTPRILDALDEFGWKSTFFCLGTQVQRSPALVTEIVARGHEIGVHGFDHRSHLRRPIPSVVSDVRRCARLLAGLTGTEPNWLRPPYGALSVSSLAAARRCGLKTVLWTTWGLDWEPGATGKSVAGHISRTWWQGATVLLHDSDLTSSPGSWRATLEALPILESMWSQQGLQVGPLREHFDTPQGRFEVPPRSFEVQE
jgi:peptidoglycan-N-acetylglucosamine deacetylase